MVTKRPDLELVMAKPRIDDALSNIVVDRRLQMSILKMNLQLASLYVSEFFIVYSQSLHTIVLFVRASPSKRRRQLAAASYTPPQHRRQVAGDELIYILN